MDYVLSDLELRSKGQNRFANNSVHNFFIIIVENRDKI